MNLVGAALLAVYAFLLVAWASVVLNAVWGLIAAVALFRVMRKRTRADVAPDE
jgi:energy-converting hydrogenase Eha subunit C